VIGGSDRPGSVGAVVLRNLRAGGFQGSIDVVNHRHKVVDGDASWPDVAALPAVPDLAVICTPAATVPGLVAQLADKGCRALVVLSAGMQEKDGSGNTLQQAMLDAARPALVRILGPNCIGLLVPGIGLNASFAPSGAVAGKIAFVAQSGALAAAMLDWAAARMIGFSHFISIGECADVDFGDVLDYLGSDAGTRAILMYVESVHDARKFMSAARAASRNKPVLLVKAGRAPEGARAAASHTGSMAGSDAVFDAAVRRSGMLRVPTLQDLFEAAETLSCGLTLDGDRLAILTNGGGAGVLAADALSLAGGTAASLAQQTLAALDAHLPAVWPRGNPVDIIGDADAGRYASALQVLLEAREVDGILLIHAPTALSPAVDIARACAAVAKTSRKPLLACWLGEASAVPARREFAAAGLPCYGTPEQGVEAWLQLARYRANQIALQQLPSAGRPELAGARAAAMQVVGDAASRGHEWLDPAQSQALLSAFGIPAVRTVHAGDAAQAAAAACDIGFPVAMKAVSQQLVHKSDAGGVALDLASRQQVADAAVKMRQRIARESPQARVQGFALQPMTAHPGAREFIVGLATDEVFGPVVLFGEGGVEAELSARHAIGLPPLDKVFAGDLIARSGLAPVMQAHRGKPALDVEAVKDVLAAVSRIAMEMPEIAELDINPLLAWPGGAIAMDARVRLHPPGGPPRTPPAIRPYPAQLARTLQLCGEALCVRPIRPDDGDLLKAFYAGAEPADMQLRFFMARREVPHSELARYCQIDYEREMCFIAVTGGPDGQARAIAGEARAVCDPDNIRAEFAIQVARPWQGKGLGRLLLGRLVEYLKERGTRELAGSCLVHNVGMTALARSMGFKVTHSDAEQATAMRLDLP
jgi:acetyltransferase